MNKSVVVTASNGKVVIPSKKGNGYGYIRVEQERILINEEGFGKVQKLSACIPGSLVDLQRFGWEEGQEVVGKIQVIESTEPFNSDDPDRDIKLAGDTMIPCKIGDQVIYRKCKYVQNPHEEDILVKHDNQEEILKAFQEKAAEGSEGDFEV